MRSPFSVTRRHLDFLFNREETAVAAEQVFWNDLAADLRNPEFRRGYEAAWARIQGEGDWQLTTSDESKVGED